MLRNDSRSINIQSTSVIKGKEVASFSISVSSTGSGGQLYQSIVDNKLYLDNINDVTADRMAFQDEVLKEQVELMRAVQASTERINAEIKAIAESEAAPAVSSEPATTEPAATESAPSDPPATEPAAAPEATTEAITSTGTGA